MFNELEPRFKKHAIENGQIDFLTDNMLCGFRHVYTKYKAVYTTSKDAASDKNSKNYLATFYLCVTKNEPYEMHSLVYNRASGKGLKLMMLEMILTKAEEEARFYGASLVEVTSSDVMLVEAFLNKEFKIRKYEQAHTKVNVYKGIKRMKKQASVAQLD